MYSRENSVQLQRNVSNTYTAIFNTSRRPDTQEFPWENCGQYPRLPHRWRQGYQLVIYPSTSNGISRSFLA